MCGIARRPGLRKKYNKERCSGKPLSFGLRPKGYRLRCQLGQASHGGGWSLGE